MKKILVLGAGGFIGAHLVTYLKNRGDWVRGIDLKYPEYSSNDADEFHISDLRILSNCENAIDQDFDEVYTLAADMGGSGYIFVGTHDADVVHNSGMINLNVAKLCSDRRVKKLFFSSSACAYPSFNQTDPDNPLCSEESAFPANPDSPYGWEKLFAEIMYDCFRRNYGLNVKIARFHNIFGPLSCWGNGKEKAPAALCRKVAETPNGGFIEIWGPGTQTRSFLYIDECLEGINRLINSDWGGPVNIGSEEMISINNLAYLIMDIAGKNMEIKNVPGPVGVMGRNSDNRLILSRLGWAPSKPLRYGLEKLYAWIEPQIRSGKVDLK